MDLRCYATFRLIHYSSVPSFSTNYIHASSIILYINRAFFFFSRSDRFIFRFVFGGEELFYLLVKKKWGKRIPSFPRGKEKEGAKSNPG